MKKKATKSKPAWKLRPSTIIAPHQSPLPFLNTPITEEHTTSGTCVESIGQKRPFIGDQNSSLGIKRAHLESQVMEIKQEYDTRNLIPLLKDFRIEAWSDDILARINETFLAAENALSEFNISRLDKESRRLFFMKVFRILFAPLEANDQPVNNRSIKAYRPLSPLESFFRGIHGFLNETNLSTFQSPCDNGPLPDPTLSFKSMRIFCVAYAEQMNVPAEKGRECGGSNVADTVQVSACAVQPIPEAAGDVQSSAQGAGPVNPPPQGADTVHPLPHRADVVQLHPENSTTNSTGDSNCTVDVQAAHMKTDTTLENYQKLLNELHSSRHRVKELEQQLVDMAVDKASWETKYNVLNQQFVALKESWQEKDDAAFKIIDNALTDVPILFQQHISRKVSEAATSSTNHHQDDMKSASIRVPRKQRNRYEEIIFWLKKENIKLSREMYHAQQFAISAANYIWELPQPYCSTGFSEWSPLPHDDADSEDDSNEAGDYVHALTSNGRRSAIEEPSILLNLFEDDKRHSDRPSASNSNTGVDDQSSRKDPLNPVRSLKERLQKKRQEGLGTSSSVLNISSSSVDYAEETVEDRATDHITSSNNASESNTTSKFKETLNRKVAKERAKKDGRHVDLT